MEEDIEIYYKYLDQLLEDYYLKSKGIQPKPHENNTDIILAEEDSFLMKLQQDGFIEIDLGNYRISFLGIIFHLEGGYQEKLNRETSLARIVQSNEKTLTKATFWIALGTIGLLAIETLKLILEHRQWICNLFFEP